MNGEPNSLYILARRTLVDVLALLGAHRDAIILVGAQAIYLHVGEVDFAVAPTTKDADLALDTRVLAPNPQIEDLLRHAGFESRQDEIGMWRNQRGGQIDFLVPEALAGSKGRRAAKLATQGNRLARRTKGLEGALVDHDMMEISAMDDDRRYEIAVAGPGALLIAKLHKLGERQGEANRLNAKDALDVLRLLQGVSSEELAASIQRQLSDATSRVVAEEGMEYLQVLFGSETAPGSELAAVAIEGLGDQSIIRASVAALASDLLNVIK